MSTNKQYGHQASTNESANASSPNVIEANLLGLDLDDDKSGYVPQDAWVSFFVVAFLNDLNFTYCRSHTLNEVYQDSDDILSKYIVFFNKFLTKSNEIG